MLPDVGTTLSVHEGLVDTLAASDGECQAGKEMAAVSRSEAPHRRRHVGKLERVRGKRGAAALGSKEGSCHDALAQLGSAATRLRNGLL